MVDDFRNIKDSIFRSVIATLNSVAEGDGEKKSGSARLDSSSARELLSMAAGWAGKGKDEIVQILCREIGMAVAAVIKEPLTQVLENRKLQISMELVPKEESEEPAPTKKKKTKSGTSSTRSKKKSTMSK